MAREFTEAEWEKLDKLRARRDRSDPQQQREFERLNALMIFEVELPEGFNSDDYVVSLEWSGLGDTGYLVAQLPRVRHAARARVDGQGGLWLEGMLYEYTGRAEDAPRPARGMSLKAATFLAKLGERIHDEQVALGE